MSFRVLQAAGTLLIGVLVLAIGAVAGIAWESSRTDDSTKPGAVDVGFAQDMSEHHDQAILMSRSLPADVAPEVRGLADRIIAAQTAETATMRGWLQWFGLPATAEQPMAWMRHDDSVAHDADHGDHAGESAAADADGAQPTMPGMASTGDLQRLSTLRGVEAEVLFLQLMTRHHEGGIEMARAAYNDPGTRPATRQLAMSMISEQGDEIGLMRMLLLARGAEPLPG